VRATAIAGLVSQGPHFAYHAAHLELLPTLGDRIAQTVVLGLALVLSALLLIGAARLEAPARPAGAGANAGGRRVPLVGDLADRGSSAV
jgi:hypothetical protein